MMNRAVSILACSTISLLAGHSHGQESPAPTPSPEAKAEAVPPERVREFLVRRRDAAEATRARLDEAIGRFDRGEPIDPAWFEELRDSVGDRPFGRSRAGDFGEGRLDRDAAPRERRGDDRVRDGREGPDGVTPGLQPGSPEESRRMRVFVDEHLPLLAERLRSIELEDPDGPRRMLTRLAPRLREAMEAKQRSPEMFELRVTELQQGFAVIEAGRRARAAIASEGADSPRAREAIDRFRTLASDHYRTQVRLQETEVAELEARVSDLRAEIRRKTESQDSGIASRVDALLRGGPEIGPGERRREGARDTGPEGEGERRRNPKGPPSGPQ